MYQTRRQLKDKIADLEASLRAEKRHSAFLDAATLPPCKNLSCVNCEHIVIYKTLTGGLYPLGCGKNIDCSDFIHRKDILSEKEKVRLQQQILEQESL